MRRSHLSEIKLTPVERSLAEKELKKLARRTYLIAPPRKRGDPIAMLCGQYLMEIGWKPGDGIPKHLRPAPWWMFWKS